MVGGIVIERAQKRILARDKIDRKFERERIRKLHRERRLKARQRGGDGGDDRGVVLASVDTGEEEEEDVESCGEGTGGSGQGVAGARRKGEGKGRNKKLQSDEELAKYLLEKTFF